MDPTLLKKQQQLKATSSYHPSPKNPDPILPARPFNMSKHLSRLYPNHKTGVTSTTQKPCKNNPPPTCRDIHLQAKSMTLSADFDASKFSHVKTKHHQTVETKVVKEACKEKVTKNDGNSEVQEVEKKKNKVKGLAVVEGHEVLKRMSVSSVGGGGGGGGGGRRRRSFCGSQVELSDFLASNGAKVVSVDMPPFMQIHAVDCARKTRDSLEKFTSKALALTLKKEFDGVYGPAWHCIVGTSFGSFVTHSVGGFLYFSLDQKLYILLFKTTVQRAD